jgi:hypothetical protein
MSRLHHRIAGALGAAIIGAVLFSGCGGDSGPTGKDASPTAPADPKEEKRQKDAEGKLEKLYKGKTKPAG